MSNLVLMNWMLFCFLLVLSVLTAYAVPLLWEMRQSWRDCREKRYIADAVWEAAEAYTAGEIQPWALVYEACQIARGKGASPVRLRERVEIELKKRGWE